MSLGSFSSTGSSREWQPLKNRLIVGTKVIVSANARLVVIINPRLSGIGKLRVFCETYGEISNKRTLDGSMIGKRTSHAACC
jgi:hypothetical protein